MESNNFILYSSDYFHFREWIKLDLDSVTWQGRYINEFDDFWSVFFIDGLSISQLFERFEYAIFRGKIGPISSWFSWIRQKFLAYIFIHRKISIYELELLTKMRASEISYLLRDFFLSKFPEYEEDFCSYFTIGNVASKNLYLQYEEIDEMLKMGKSFDGKTENDIMGTMEITLYTEWKTFVKRLKKELFHKNFNFESLLKNTSLKQVSKFILELFVLIITGLILVYVTQLGNKFYESYLAEKIIVNEPTFFWLDNNLRFKEIDKKNVGKIKTVSLDKIEDIPHITKDVDRVSIQESSTFGTESEVALTSWNALPKDFNNTELEESVYEENDVSGNRDTQFGSRRVFRVMMNSADPLKSKLQLNTLIKEYNVSQVDNVKPGQMVPGGVYYNIYVPRNNLKEFISRVMEIDDSLIYETKTRGVNPPGQNRIFIWIKRL